MVSEPEDFPGTSRFQILRFLGEGGMGVVYEALDKTTNERVALKTLRALTADSLWRFKQEFRVLQDIEHRHLISLHELIADDEAGWFFTMELVDGPDFLEYVRESSVSPPTLDTPTIEVTPQAIVLPSTPPRRRGSGKLNEALLRDAMAQLVRGLMVLHEAGKIHRDIKPSNVLVDRRDSSARVVLLDFGLAVAHARQPQVDSLNSQELEPNTIVGTVDYMSPEQAAGHPLGPETDWYSVGVMLFEALTGDVPFTGGPIDVLFAKQRGEAKPPRTLNPAIPEDLDALCSDLLRFAPSARPSALEILERLGGRGAPERTSSASGAAARSFVGREAELTRLHSAFEESRLGRGGSVYVFGESGVGKSSLVRRFISEAREQSRDLVLLTGRCYERESVPYKAMDGVIDALSNHLVKTASAEVVTLLPPSANLLAEVFPVLSRVPAVVEAPVQANPIIDPVERRSRVFGALRELFVRLSKRHPVLLVIDDLQWADDDSRALLAELLRTPDAPPLLLVATLRPIDSSIDTPLTGLPDPTERIDLDRLPFDQAMRIADHIARTIAPERTLPLQQLVEEAGGHPLFLDELIRFSASSDLTTTRPVQLEDALRARILALDTDARQLLSLVALAGKPIRQITAAQATGLGPTFAKQIGLLRVAHLIRTNGMRGTDRVETFHDRVRSAALSVVPQATRPELHRKLAVAFETSGQIEPETQMLHWAEAGDRTRAATYARQAAEQAERALAFDRAARLYQQCLDCSPTDPQVRRGLRICLGDALTNAGRGASAANEYMAAAELSDATNALDLKRRAAEQLLRAGHIEQGVSTLRDVLKAVGLDLASTPRRALASLLLRRVKTRLRGLSYRERSANEIAQSDLMRIDACWSAATGLGMIDTVRGSDFQTQHLLFALAAGEPYRIARALSMEAAITATSGASSAERAVRLQQQAEALSLRIGHPHAIALARLMSGFLSFQLGRWAAANRALAAAQALCREQCVGVAWELTSANVFRLGALFYLGEFRELKVAVPALMQDADARGDLYASTNLGLTHMNSIWLVDDEPARARLNAEHAMNRFPATGYLAQHYYALFAHTNIDLYEGNGEAATARVEKDWSALQGSLFLRVQVVRIEATHLRGRAALAALSSNDSVSHRAGVRKAAAALRGEKLPWATGLASLLEAGLARHDKDEATATLHLRSAAAALAAADMTLYAAVAKDAIGHTRDSIWDAQRIAAPGRFARMLAPGLD